MRNGKEYIESLRRMKTKVYYQGNLIENLTEHPLIKPHINSARLTYDLPFSPKHNEIMTTVSHLTGEKINRFTSVHQSAGDLVSKVKMLRTIAQVSGSCFQRCVGFDAINAVYTVTFEMDKKNGSDYHEKFKEFLKRVQQKDLMIAGAMTDPKGDRSLSPGKQTDPDIYVHVVEKNEKGIVINGAKAHMTGIVNSNEMLIMPTVALSKDDEDYAVCCSVPVDAPGIFHVFGRQTNDGRRLCEDDIDQGNHKYGIVGGEALTVLEKVFVPWENVYMCGESEWAGLLVERFACYHRQNYGACKGGVSDVVTGAAALLAEYNGVEKASHIKDKLIEMILLTETLYSCSLACSHEGCPTASGAYFVDALLANVTKQNVTRLIYEIDRIAQDIAGGFIATLPSDKDLRHPEIGKYVEKFFKGRDDVNTEDRIRIARLIENMTGGTALVESMHGAGSPQAQRVVLSRQADLEGKKRFARIIAGIKVPPAEKEA